NKAALFDVDLNLISQTKINYPLFYPKPGWAEQNAEDYWNSVEKATHILINEGKVNQNDILALIFDCQMNCTVPIDIEGIPLMNCISWLDTRSAAITHKFTKGIIKISNHGLHKLLMFIKITGGAPGINGKDPISHILWIKEKLPEIYEKTFKFLSVKDFVVYRCTKNAVTSRDLGNTSWMMDTNPGKYEWSDKILNKFGIDKEKLPQIRRSTEIAGELTAEASHKLGLGPGIPVFVGSGDLTSAALGSGAILDNEPIVCLGTADWVAAHTSERLRDLIHYTGGICSSQDNYLCISKQETGTACLDWVINQMFRDEKEKFEGKDEELYKSINAMVEKSKVGANNLLFTPWLFGERSPLNDPNVRGGFYNLSLDHSREDLLRAVYEGVVYNIKWALKIVEKLVGKTEKINFIGGGAKSSIWCQILADVLERNIVQMEDPDLAAAKGSAIISMVGLGLLKDFSGAIPLIKIKQNYTPNPNNKKIYSKLFTEYMKIYKRNKKMFKHLNL
ncbi:MAG: FGGY-family carbohydrate kinase, partial [Candidatus Thorarchaeota archaeon]